MVVGGACDRGPAVALSAVAEVPADRWRGDRSSALHEAGHVILAGALGLQVATVTLVGHPHMEAEPSQWLSPAQSVALDIAGHIAERWGRRLIYRPNDAELGWFISAVTECTAGQCDGCSAIRTIIVELRHPKYNAPFLARYREIELATIEFVTHRRVFRIIERLATALLERGTLAGDEINALIGADISALDVRLVV